MISRLDTLLIFATIQKGSVTITTKLAKQMVVTSNADLYYLFSKIIALNLINIVKYQYEAYSRNYSN